MKMTEEFWVRFCVNVLGVSNLSWTQSRGPSYGRSGANNTANSRGVQLSDIRSTATRSFHKPFNADRVTTTGSNESQEHIVDVPAGGIKIQTDYYVSVEETRDRAARPSVDHEMKRSSDPSRETYAVAQ